MKKLFSILFLATLLSCSESDSERQSGENCVKAIYKYGVLTISNGTPIWGYTFQYNQDDDTAESLYNDGQYHQIDGNMYFKIVCE